MRRIRFALRTLLCALIGHRPFLSRNKCALLVAGSRPVPSFVCSRCRGAFAVVSLAPR